MANVVVPVEVKSASISAIVFRANGDVEDLGVIARYDRDEEQATEDETVGTVSVELNQEQG